MIDNVVKRPRAILAMLALAFTCLWSFSTAQALEPSLSLAVVKVVQAFKNNNRVALSKLVSYPLLRQVPLAPINNQREFLGRYDEVFDKKLVNIITQSDIHADWGSIGWRGVVLYDGIIALDPDGSITAVNYFSPREKALVNKLNASNTAEHEARGRRALHRSVTNYTQSLVELNTKRFHIRIDDVGNGELRYTSWAINKSTLDTPDLILTHGRMFKNNGRNQRFVFDNGTYRYQLNINSVGLDNKSSGSLEVFKAGQPWASEVATQITRR